MKVERCNKKPAEAGFSNVVGDKGFRPDPLVPNQIKSYRAALITVCPNYATKCRELKSKMP